MILRREHVRHPAVGLEQPDTPDAPIATGLGQLVGVERHVRAVKASDAEVHDARDERGAVVVRYADAETFDLREFGRREPHRHTGERTTPI